MNEPRIWPNSPEEEHRLRQDIAARATQDSSEPDAAKELVKAIRRARHDGVKLVAAHDAALIAKTLAARQAAESPCPKCAENEHLASEYENERNSAIIEIERLQRAERSLAEVSADEVREAAARLRAFESQFTPAERGPNDKDICTLCAFVAGTFSLRASGTALAGILKEGTQRMTDLMAEYAEAGELDRPFIRACDDWLTKASASLAAAPTLSEAGAQARVEEAKWWRHQIDPNWIHGPAGECNCVWCKRINELERAAPEAGAKEASE